MGLGVTQRHDWGWVRGGQAGIRETRLRVPRAQAPEELDVSVAGLGSPRARHSAARKRGGHRGSVRARALTAPQAPLVADWLRRSESGTPSRASPRPSDPLPDALVSGSAAGCPTWGLVAAGSAGSPTAPQSSCPLKPPLGCCFLGSRAPQLPWRACSRLLQAGG